MLYVYIEKLITASLIKNFYHHCLISHYKLINSIITIKTF